MASADAQDFEQHRQRLTGLAYRMLGSLAEAEDVVQDAWLRWDRAARTDVEAPGAFLSRVVTRLCLDRLKSARRTREIYVGPWLPEPLVSDAALTAEPVEDLAHDVSFALMLALERLSPLERAAFLLHDVFELDFAEVAGALGRTEAACRQLASRARANVQTDRPRFTLPPDEGERIATAFFAATRTGDVGALRGLLADGAVLQSDGGGRRRAALNPILGAERISRFYAGIQRKAGPPLWQERVSINGLPGRASLEFDGTLQTIALEIAEGRIRAVYVTRNPDKLRHLLARLPAGLQPS